MLLNIFTATILVLYTIGVFFSVFIVTELLYVLIPIAAICLFFLAEGRNRLYRFAIYLFTPLLLATMWPIASGTFQYFLGRPELIAHGIGGGLAFDYDSGLYKHTVSCESSFVLNEFLQNNTLLMLSKSLGKPKYGYSHKLPDKLQILHKIESIQAIERKAFAAKYLAQDSTTARTYFLGQFPFKLDNPVRLSQFEDGIFYEINENLDVIILKGSKKQSRTIHYVNPKSKEVFGFDRI